jgi:tight adherence protein C
MVSLVLPISFAIAAFLAIRAFASVRSTKPARAAWQQELMGSRQQQPEPVRRRRRENLRTKSLFERLIQAPPSITRPADRLVQSAGAADQMTGTALIGLSAVVGTLAALLWMFYASSEGFTQREIVLTVAAAAIGIAGPWIVLSGRATRRRDAITAELPDMVDLLTVSIEAGLALEAALSRVSERGDGPLAQEVRRTLSEIALGRQRRDALRALGERTQVPAVATFVNSLIQADQSGMELGPVLRAQSDQVRQRRRQRAEESAMKAPIKMLFPLILFIFPSIFIVLLGPAAVSLLGDDSPF